MRTVAEKTVDASGSLSSSGHGTGNVGAGAMRILDIGESDSTSVEDALWAGTGVAQALLYWEHRGGFCITVFVFLDPKHHSERIGRSLRRSEKEPYVKRQRLGSARENHR